VGVHQNPSQEIFLQCTTGLIASQARHVLQALSLVVNLVVNLYAEGITNPGSLRVSQCEFLSPWLSHRSEPLEAKPQSILNSAVLIPSQLQ
jgi:hypothetical protein